MTLEFRNGVTRGASILNFREAPERYGVSPGTKELNNARNDGCEIFAHACKGAQVRVWVSS